MKNYLLIGSLCLPVFLFAQPILTLDYFFQEGKYEYCFMDVPSEIIEAEGADVVWDFSKPNIQPFSKLNHAYKLDTILGNDVYSVLPLFGIHLNTDLGDANRIFTTSFGKHNGLLQLLEINEEVHLISTGFWDYDTGGLSDLNTKETQKIFPKHLTFQEQITDTLRLTIDSNILTTNTLIYSSYGSFIHPNGATICDVIQLKRIYPSYNGEIIIVEMN